MFAFTHSSINISKVIAGLLWAVFFGSVVALAVVLFDDYKALNPASSGHVTRSQTTALPKKAIDVEFSQIHLFGKANTVSEVKPPEDIPATRLNLELKGVFASSNPDRASALVGEKNKPSTRYFVEDKLPGGAVLKSVDRDFITLSRSGQLEILRFPEAKDSSQAPKRNNLASRSSRENTRVATNSQTESLKERIERYRQNKQ